MAHKLKATVNNWKNADDILKDGVISALLHTFVWNLMQKSSFFYFLQKRIQVLAYSLFKIYWSLVQI